LHAEVLVAIKMYYIYIFIGMAGVVKLERPKLV